MPPIPSDKACYSNNKASGDLAGTFLQASTESLLVAPEGALEEALDQELAHFLEVLLDPEVEGLRMEAIEPPISSSKARYNNNSKA